MFDCLSFIVVLALFLLFSPTIVLGEERSVAFLLFKWFFGGFLLSLICICTVIKSGRSFYIGFGRYVFLRLSSGPPGTKWDGFIFLLSFCGG